MQAAKFTLKMLCISKIKQLIGMFYLCYCTLLRILNKPSDGDGKKSPAS